ncbi:MAG TPA: NADH-quinone oxidoreductase subunit C [Candidatus Polarisedimenticolia bacterium]|nr:NADH-quinone oxidoreductase subunit C [Candidatus Polarisedimenticolia bacterium]
MGGASPLAVGNAAVVPLRDVPGVGVEEFRTTLVDEITTGGRVSALFGTPHDAGRLEIVAVVARPAQQRLGLLSTVVTDRYPSLTPDCPQLANFEREIAEQWGVRPEGHPWLKPLRYHESLSTSTAAPMLPAVVPFFTVEGEEVHEVAVGPVHAGIIEPGHFRFQCHGETVLHLEISLGYQHRGVETALVGGPDKRTIHYMETVAGDTTAGHALAYARAVEALSGHEPPAGAEALRSVALELERLANHAGDLGALAGDVGYLPTASFCGRLRGEFLNLTALACGSRLGRGWIRPGGVAFDIGSHAGEMRTRLAAAMEDLRRSAGLLWNTSTVRARFEETGTLTPEVCRTLGLVGPVARASGIAEDVRCDFPCGVDRRAPVKVATWPTGDVFARARVRWLEAQESARLVDTQLAGTAGGPVREDPGALQPVSIAVSLVEGWRGEICHVATTDERGRFARYKIVDPSFHNWPGLELAMRQQSISDFPLCNKSFNLSYCGHDL